MGRAQGHSESYMIDSGYAKARHKAALAIWIKVSYKEYVQIDVQSTPVI